MLEDKPILDLISIVIPVKNGSEYLGQCLFSILQQSHRNWELIIVNDHSTDDTLDIIQSFSNEDKRIKVFENDGYGITPALIKAYNHTSGFFITRMDADDMMTHDKLEKLYTQLIHKGRNYVAVAKVKYFAGFPLGNGYLKYEKWLNELILNGQHKNQLYKECVIPSPCWMMYMDDFKRIGAFNAESYPEDYDLCFRMFQHNLHITGIPEVLHLWRDHQTRSSRTDPNYADNRFLDLKWTYFKKINFQIKKELVLWGAGQKGKYLAKKILEDDLSFTWLSNNEKKIGINIYDVIIQSETYILNATKVDILIAVANPVEQKEIRSTLNKLNFIEGKDFYFFC